ncbi:MAG TPA: phage tail protein [Egibacteraceae bacterium]|jgi:phage tail-like protein|nr:phage tail protein [Egibacteraceae bacterium]
MNAPSATATATAPSGAAAIADPAVTVCFGVRIDGQDIGSFASCDGLGMEVEIQEVKEGGNPFFVHQLPGRIKYSRIKLTRPVNADSVKVAAWIAGMATEVKRTQVEIRAMNQKGDSIATWVLFDAFPYKWSGPSLNVEGPKVATETLELAHHGFLMPPTSSPA